MPDIICTVCRGESATGCAVCNPKMHNPLQEILKDTTIMKALAGDCRKCREYKAKVERLERLVKMGEAVVEDFLPNIGHCVLQDYGRMNDFLMEASELNSTQE